MPPRLAKLLALIVAVALVAGAFWYRARSDDDGKNGDGGNGASGSGTLEIRCVAELSDVCSALDDVEITVEDAGTTSDTLVDLESGTPPFDAWVTFAPWPEMVDVERQAGQSTPLFSDESSAAASMPLTILTFASVVQELGPECGGDVDWACLGDSAGPQDRVSVPPGESALGILVAGQAASSQLGTTSFDRDDIMEAPFQAWLEQLLGSPTSRTSDAPTRMLQQGRAAFIAAGTGQAVADDAARSNRGQQLGMLVLEPDPAATVQVVVAPLVSGDRADRARALLTGNTGASALRQAGWTVPAPPGGTGLPDAGVLVALRQEIE